MKVTIGEGLRVHLKDMTFKEAMGPWAMIKGTALPERRMFDRVKRDLEKPIDELMEPEEIEKLEALEALEEREASKEREGLKIEDLAELEELEKLAELEAVNMPVGGLEVRIGENVTDIMRLPCVAACHKTAHTGELIYELYGDPRRYAQPGDWLCQDSNGEWSVVSERERACKRAAAEPRLTEKE